MSDLSPLAVALFFADEPPEGYARRFDEYGVWYRPTRSRARWWHMDYPVCEVEPCGGCGRFFSKAALYSGHLPIMHRPPRWIEGVDYGPGAFRHVCRGCANRFDALHRRWSIAREVTRLINRLDREIGNARKKASA